MSTPTDKKYETIGRTVWSIGYLLYALKFIAVASVIALAVLFFINKPLWLAPIIGAVIFLVYRFIYRIIITGIIRLVRKASGEDED